VKPDTAESTARDINASLLLYGYVDMRENPPQLVIKFWVTPQSQYGFEDIQGSYGVGKPIRIVDINNPGAGIQGELQGQSSAIAWIGIGLTNEQLGQSADALKAFLQAGAVAPQSEMVQFFIGRGYLFVSAFEPDRKEIDWQAAEDVLQKAIALNNQYARAYISLGDVYFNRSASLLQTAVDSNQDVDPLAEQWVEKAIQTYQRVLDLKPDPIQYGNPVEDVARLSLGNAYRLKGAIALSRGDVTSALNALNQAIQTIQEILPVFEASTKQHESHRRYLAQTYEYLGEAYQWQGAALERMQDYPHALEAYQNSLSFYNACKSQGQNTLDLVIKNNIVGKRCQPYYQETKDTYDALNGGQ
jgi:tetratricopeptide (TPR) repeat protein